jgi:hypothetical protein
VSTDITRADIADVGLYLAGVLTGIVLVMRLLKIAMHIVAGERPDLNRPKRKKNRPRDPPDSDGET